MTGDERLAMILESNQSHLHNMVDDLDTCPHEAAVLGYLVGMLHGLPCKSRNRVTIDLAVSIANMLSEVNEYGLPGERRARGNLGRW